MKKCISGKNGYENEKAAMDAADLGVFCLKKKNLKLSVYVCLNCFKWHLTSSKKKSKGKK